MSACVVLLLVLAAVDAEAVWLVRHARFDAAAARPGADRVELARAQDAYRAALERARSATDAAMQALALGQALQVAPESEVVLELLGALPERTEPYPLTPERDARSLLPSLIYVARDAGIMTLVPGGAFLLGSARADALPEEQPQRSVVLAAFYVDRYEVTNRRYAKFVARTGHAPPPHWSGGVPAPALLDLPVTWVSYDDAVAYLRWAGGRLPTEIEWERAARGVDGRTYPWGEQLPTTELAQIGQLAATSPAPVASHPLGASPMGCVDMSGNALEWTLDCYAPYRYAALGENSPTPPPVASGNYRVLRGGAFLDIPEFGRTTFRSFLKPESRNGICGFRGARDG